MTLVKSCLSLNHGKASFERGLSDNKNTLTMEKKTKLKDSTLSALRKAKEHIRACGVLVVSIHFQKVGKKV